MNHLDFSLPPSRTNLNHLNDPFSALRSENSSVSPSLFEANRQASLRRIRLEQVESPGSLFSIRLQKSASAMMTDKRALSKVSREGERFGYGLAKHTMQERSETIILDKFVCV